MAHSKLVNIMPIHAIPMKGAYRLGIFGSSAADALVFPLLKTFSVTLASCFDTYDPLSPATVRNYLDFIRNHPRLEVLSLPRGRVMPSFQTSILLNALDVTYGLCPTLSRLRSFRGSLQMALYLSPCFADSPIEEVYLEDMSLPTAHPVLHGKLESNEIKSQENAKVSWPFYHVRKLTLAYYNNRCSTIPRDGIISKLFLGVQDVTLDFRDVSRFPWFPHTDSR